MASPSGGQFIIGPPIGFTSVSMAVNSGNGIPGASSVAGTFNIEVFTAAGATLPANPDTGFKDAILDPNGSLTGNFLNTSTTPGGSSLTLGSGNYTITDQVTVAGRGVTSVTLGSGNQRVVGGPGDTLRGGSGSGILDGIQQFQGGPETIIGGSGPTTVFGGPGDSVVAGAGNTYVDGTAGGMKIGVGSAGTDTFIGTSSTNTISGAANFGGADTFTGGAAAVNIQSLGKGDVVNFANQTGNATITANANTKITHGRLSELTHERSGGIGGG